MRKLIGLLFIIPLAIQAQTPVSGIINRYAAVSAINYCSAALTVSDPGAFSAGDHVLLIQMQGAEINTSNNANFGTITQLNAAGLYEWATIQEVTGNEVRLQFALVNTYNVNGGLQLVYVPKYENALITGTLTAPAWNGLTGGVLALEVMFSLDFQADVDMSGKGFRGGLVNIDATNNCSWLTPQSGYTYSLNNWRAAAKGEGIAAFTPGAEAGRGPQANGGGGGNDHNAGGGGGGHLAAGGRGGNNEEPTTFGCSGNFPGLGGRAITSSDQRIFMGGGGGAGHENNDLGSSGGNGGGIVFIKAPFVQGNGHVVRANGADAGNSLSDGAGGGGAGGTIIMPALSVLNLSFEAKGGKGGDADNGNAARCMGPGGGGAGGRIIGGGISPPFNVSPGQNGRSINSTACTAGPNGAQSGMQGPQQGLLNPFVEGSTPLTPPAVVQQPPPATACPGDTIVFSAVVSGNISGLQWQVNTGSGFQNISNNDTYSGAQTSILTIANASLAMSGYQYRLNIVSNCFPAIASGNAMLTVNPLPVAGFSFTVSGNTVQFTNSSQAATQYQWIFGDGNTSQAFSPSHAYSGAGSFAVHLIASNSCGADTSTIVVSIAGAPTAGFTSSTQNGCAPLSVGFSSNTSTSAGVFQWFFPGGQPAASTLPNPQVIYNSPGIFDVTLIASNANGSDTLTLSQYIQVTGPPNAAFSAQSSGGLSFSFGNASQGATAYFWNFGDGNTSTASNPVHNYSSPGFYSVTLTASNTCGSATFTAVVTAGQLPQAGFGQSTQEGCAPVAVQFNDQSSGSYSSRQWSFPGGNPSISTAATQTVIYSQPGTYDVTLTLNGPLGPSTSTITGAVTVYPFPTPAFSFSIQGMTVAFTNNSSNATSYSWLFGDGNNSQAVSPVHTYAAPGVYTVTLNAQRPFCASSTSATVVIMPTSAQETESTRALTVFPNPATERIFLQWNNDNPARTRYRLWSNTGLPVIEGSFSGQTVLEIGGLPNGLYLLELERDAFRNVWKVIKS